MKKRTAISILTMALIYSNFSLASTLNCTYSVNKMVPVANSKVGGMTQLVKVADQVPLVAGVRDAQYESATSSASLASLGLKFSATQNLAQFSYAITDSAKDVSVNAFQSFQENSQRGALPLLAYHKKLNGVEYDIYLNCGWKD